jgi:hypothetical protein
VNKLLGLIVDPEDKKTFTPEYINYKCYLLFGQDLVQVETDEGLKKTMLKVKKKSFNYSYDYLGFY